MSSLSTEGEPSRRERDLTASEVDVISALLQGSLESGEERIRRSGLPRATFRVAMRRLYQAGVLVDRYIPSPGILGMKRVVFLLSKPFSDRLSEVIRDMESSPGCVVLLTSPNYLFAVFFIGSEEAGVRLRGRFDSGDFGTPVSFIATSSGKEEIPVYFDFEGIWSHFSGNQGVAHYPRPLPSGAESTTRNWFGKASDSTVLHTLFMRTTSDNDDARPAHLTGPATLSRSQRRALLTDQAAWRVMLSLSNPPSIREIGIRHLLLVQGRLKKGRDPLALFRTLTAECGVFPFLFASDGMCVLMAGFGTGLQQDNVEYSGILAKQPVVRAMTDRLENVVTVREPLENIVVRVWHRYDPLLE